MINPYAFGFPPAGVDLMMQAGYAQGFGQAGMAMPFELALQQQQQQQQQQQLLLQQLGGAHAAAAGASLPPSALPAMPAAAGAGAAPTAFLPPYLAALPFAPFDASGQAQQSFFFPQAAAAGQTAQTGLPSFGGMGASTGAGAPGQSQFASPASGAGATATPVMSNQPMLIPSVGAPGGSSAGGAQTAQASFYPSAYQAWQAQVAAAQAQQQAAQQQTPSGR